MDMEDSMGARPARVDDVKARDAILCSSVPN